MEPQPQVALPQELAARAREDEVERRDAAQMAQLRVSLGPQERQPQELLQVSRQQVSERAAAQLSLKMKARATEALRSDAPLCFRESH
jgi:hypothetical protein